VHHNKFLFNNQPGWNCPDSAWKWSSNLHETYQCQMYSRKLLMMGREYAQNM